MPSRPILAPCFLILSTLHMCGILCKHGESIPVSALVFHLPQQQSTTIKPEHHPSQIRVYHRCLRDQLLRNTISAPSTAHSCANSRPSNWVPSPRPSPPLHLPLPPSATVSARPSHPPPSTLLPTPASCCASARRPSNFYSISAHRGCILRCWRGIIPGYGLTRRTGSGSGCG
jgi:hypothetical protein